MFVQMHMLQSMPPGNLNRDDTGQPKRCLFGGTTRGRISSQCLKRNIRHSDVFVKAFAEGVAIQSRFLPRLVVDEMRAGAVISEEEKLGVQTGIARLFVGKAKREAAEADESDSPKQDADADYPGKTGQVVCFPPPFVKKIAEILASLRQNEPQAWKLFVGTTKQKKNKNDDLSRTLDAYWKRVLEARESLSVDIALFGRMTTSSIINEVSASCQVAHAISTHETLTESDYFTAVDDLSRDGAGFVSSADACAYFNSAVYYKYLNVDNDALAKTLGSHGANQAQKAAAVLLQAAALATPTGKQNSFAAHSVPELILVEVSATKQPISYANAFLEAVQGADLMRESAQALSDYGGSIAAAYAPADMQRFLLAVGSAAPVAFSLNATRAATLAELANAVEKAVSSPAAPGAA